MRADVDFATSFRCLRLSEPVDDFELMPGVHISNSADVRRRRIGAAFRQAAGQVEAAHLIGEPNFVFGDFSEADLRKLPPPEFAKAVLLWISMLFDGAWLLRDHAMRCEGLWLTHWRAPGGPAWNTNFLAQRPLTSTGGDEEVVMTLADLRAWAEMTHQMESYLHEKRSSRVRFMMERGYARSGRAMRFIRAARTADDLAFRITHYCSALETLFTTDAAELSHKLAERTAFFLGDRGHDRMFVFRTVKRAYTVRSKLVHGGTLTDKQIDELFDLSTAIDGFLRTILVEIFQSEESQAVFDRHDDAIETFFTDLILGPSKG